MSSEKLHLNYYLKMVPNSLTLCNSICGFVAIVYMLQVYEMPQYRSLAVFATSAWIIICAMIFDVLDGFAARIFNAASLHGIQMDSLADMVTFGVAPATICAIMTHVLREDETTSFLIYALCAVYLGCSALRLATYNVRAMAKEESSGFFSGLPTPGAAACVCSMAMLLNYIDFLGPWKHMHKLALYIPCYAAILGLLMVTPIPYPHMRKWFFSVWRSKRKLALLVIMIMIVFVFKTPGLFILVNIYAFSGPISAVYRRITRKEKTL